MKWFNSEYARLLFEVPLALAYKVRAPRASANREIRARILIVNVCLIGEFAMSAPAIRDFIGRHPDATVDLMVSPPLKSMAQRLRGIGDVVAIRSVYARPAEGESDKIQLPEYDRVIVMRISIDAYRMLMHGRARHIELGTGEFIRQAAGLWFGLLRRQAPRQWRDACFAMLGGKPRALPLQDIFDIRAEDIEQIRALPALQTGRKVVIVHTGSNWLMKRWPIIRWAKLLQEIDQSGGYRFIVVGNTQDIIDVASIRRHFTGDLRSLCGKIDLFQLLLILNESAFFIGIDSGPANLAALAGVPSVILYGPGPHMFLPVDPRSLVLDKSNGGGFLQMFFAVKNSYIERISVADVLTAFNQVAEAT